MTPTPVEIPITSATYENVVQRSSSYERESPDRQPHVESDTSSTQLYGHNEQSADSADDDSQFSNPESQSPEPSTSQSGEASQSSEKTCRPTSVAIVQMTSMTRMRVLLILSSRATRTARRLKATAGEI
ncbi:hypothetical protein L596_024094 [Steinernema carpocapsae]|uniref:Uncharacterized protein n=1 Tax=Steinernema carpocapsae TaxID=34508 RepID=A0A4U5MFP6_STECR|nr:hypothetical protein L596_024094 [Steinernema carpocapsae]